MNTNEIDHVSNTGYTGKFCKEKSTERKATLLRRTYEAMAYANEVVGARIHNEGTKLGRRCAKAAYREYARDQRIAMLAANARDRKLRKFKEDVTQVIANA